MNHTFNLKCIFSFNVLDYVDFEDIIHKSQSKLSCNHKLSQKCYVNHFLLTYSFPIGSKCFFPPEDDIFVDDNDINGNDNDETDGNETEGPAIK